MEVISTHKDLLVWQKSVELASKVYAATRASANHDELHPELRRAAVAVASAIAEGAACRRRGEFLKFLQRARGSLLEMETHVLIAQHQKLIPEGAALLNDISELERLMTALMRRLMDTTRHAHARACALELNSHRPHSAKLRN
jgi:four helix bundle protein